MAFGKVAAVGIACVLGQAMTTIGLAVLGFGSMSFAWGSVCGGLCGIAMLLAIGIERDHFRLSLAGWQQSAKFGAYDSATAMLNRLWELLPSFVFARILGVDAVGLYSRAQAICQLPEKSLFAGLSSVLLPAFASRARGGQSLKQGYLRTIEYITVLHWPALLMLVLLADPIVRIMLGKQWLAAVPIVQIIAGAMLLWFPAYLSYPSLVAAGAVSDTLRSSLISLPISAVILLLAAPHGLVAVALSMFVIIPLQVAVAVTLVRRHIGFSYMEFLGALRRSILVTLASAAGPLFCVVAIGLRAERSSAEVVVIALSGVAGWVVGLRWSGHPVWHELIKGKRLVAERLGMWRAGGDSLSIVSETRELTEQRATRVVSSR